MAKCVVLEKCEQFSRETNRQADRVEGFAKESFKGFQMCRNYAFKDAFQQKQTWQSVKKDECRQ